MTTYMQRPSDETFLRNTSPVDFVLEQTEGKVSSVSITQGSPSQSYIDVIAAEALGVTLKAGEMLLLPHKWWHRVENVGHPSSWSAGVGYWFRQR